ncbi:DNA/RNA nuclease SfsA [Thermovibrio sp.]
MKSKSLFNLKEYFGELLKGEFLERENRFTAKVLVEGSERKAHVADTGRLRELLKRGAPIILANNPKGKLDYKLVSVKSGREWVLLNTQVHGKIAQEAIKKGLLGFKPKEIRKEVKVGNSRIDFLIDGKLFIEVKGCNLVEFGKCLFPDAPTERGRKHLKELILLKRKGFSCGVLFLAFRKCSCFMPNRDRDKPFAEAFEEALKEGIKFFGLKLSFKPETGEILFKSKLKLC